MDANRERCMKASREMYGVLAGYTSSEASTIVKSVTEFGRSESVGKTARKLQQKNVGAVMFRV